MISRCYSAGLVFIHISECRLFTWNCNWSALFS